MTETTDPLRVLARETAGKIWPSTDGIVDPFYENEIEVIYAALRLAQQGTQKQLMPYLQHKSGCYAFATGECNCGFDELLATLRSQEIPK